MTSAPVPTRAALDIVERTVELESLRLHLAEAGPAGGQPVLLLHGFPEFWYCWRHQIPELAAAGYRVLAPDQRGYNRSDKAGPYDLGRLARDLVELLDELRCERVHVVAHDFGAPVAYTLAETHPARVRSLAILNGPHPRAFHDALTRHPSQLLRSWYIAFFQIPRLPEALLRRRDFAAFAAVFAEVPKSALPAEDLELYKQAFAQPGALSAALGWYRAMFRELLRHGRPPARRIEVPTLVLWGARDRELGRYVNQTLDRYVATLEVRTLAEAGHFVQLDAAAEVSRSLLGFLDQHQD